MKFAAILLFLISGISPDLVNSPVNQECGKNLYFCRSACTEIIKCEHSGDDFIPQPIKTCPGGTGKFCNLISLDCTGKICPTGSYNHTYTDLNDICGEKMYLCRSNCTELLRCSSLKNGKFRFVVEKNCPAATGKYCNAETLECNGDECKELTKVFHNKTHYASPSSMNIVFHYIFAYIFNAILIKRG